MATGPIETILAALVSAKVRFVVVGGVAVVLQGYPRFTVDLDLVVGFEPGNLLAAMRVFETLGFAPKAPVKAADFADPAIRARWIDDQGMTVFSLWSDAFRGTDVDLFVSEPIPFAELEAAATAIPLEVTTVPVASIQHLLRMKEAAGRPRDLEDARVLRGLLAESESSRDS
ncbi:MAG: hypothetical protein QG573_405 [Acidobacteriota bacterium]|nr:hypothetical protein [Acidobacteriota bacterium]